MECFAIGPVAVNAVAIALGVLHALVRTVEIHDVKRIVDEDFADQGLDDIAHWRVETALVIFCESVVLSDHRPPVGKLLGPIHKSRVLRRDFHEGMVERYVGHIFEIGFATQIQRLSHRISLKLRMNRITRFIGEIGIIGGCRIAQGIRVQLLCDSHSLLRFILERRIERGVVAFGDEDPGTTNPVVCRALGC